MLKSMRIVLAGAALAIAALGSQPALAQAHHGGAWHGGAWHGGAWHGGHGGYWHTGGAHWSFAVGVPLYWPWYYPTYYPYSYPYYGPAPAYYDYSAAPSSSVYVEQNPGGYAAPPEGGYAAPPGGYAAPGPAPVDPNAGNWWYYCNESGAYYPYAKTCPGGWQRVPPQPLQH
jgi:hypothetical protein